MTTTYQPSRDEATSEQSTQYAATYPAYPVVPQSYSVAPPQYGTHQPGILVADGHRPQRRPGVVTAAAVIGFVYGGLQLLGMAVVILALAVLASRHATPVVVVIIGIVALIGLIFPATYIWGGVAALRGRSRVPLVVIAAISATLTIIGLAVSLATQHSESAIVAQLLRSGFQMAFELPILVFISLPSSRDFFRTRRAARSY